MSRSFQGNRILIIVQNDLQGGAEQLLKNLASFTSQNKVETSIFILKSFGTGFWNELESTCSIKRLEAKNYYTGIFKLIFHLKKFDKKNFNQYLLFSSNISLNSILGFLKRMSIIHPTKLIIRETTTIFSRYSGFKLKYQTYKYKLGYEGADLIICQTERMKEDFLNQPDFVNLPLKVIKNPINLESIAELANKNCDFENFLGDHPFIVSAGRLITEKGFDILINSFKNFSSVHPSYNLLILGEGPERKNLETLIKDLGITSKVLLPGFVKNPFCFFKSADICIVSSRVEGFPNVLLQMMSQNGNVISTDCAGGVRDLKGVIITLAKKDEIENALEYANGLDKVVIIRNYQMFKDQLLERSVSGYFNEIIKSLNL